MMKRLVIALLVGALIALAIVPSAGAFGLKDLDVTLINEDGSVATQAGFHPFAQTVTLGLETTIDPESGEEILDGDTKELTASLPSGLVGDPNAVPHCSGLEFVQEKCPAASQIGITDVTVGDSTGVVENLPVDSLVPPPGVPVEFGFHVVHVPVTVDLKVSPNPPFNVLAAVRNASNATPFYHSKLTVWGVPASPAHDKERGCGGGCNLNLQEKPFLTMPRSCTGPLITSFEAFSWQQPFGPPATGFTESHDGATPPNPQGMTGCDRLAFAPSITAKPTTKAAESSTGLDFSVDVADEGLVNPKGLAASDIRKVVATLPEGVTVNPSAAQGLAVCSEADLDREVLGAAPGAGCPEASKLGTLEVQTPLLDENVNGSLYLAEPYKNPAGTLLALYFVLENEKLGILVKLTAKVEPDPVTGVLTTTVEDVPQLPFSHFRLHFREGARSPLVSPPHCGNYDVKAELTPWAGGAPVMATSSFSLISGPGGSPCPPGGIPPFHPSFQAGSINNNAGSFSPFNMRLIRNDGEQDMTKFSAILPPGELGSLKGISKCPDAAIAAAKAKTGLQELANPSCPANSLIGHTLAGAGVGSVLTYVGGQVYLGGPYKGDPLSVISVTPAVAGPFDAGTVVVRLALNLNPKTAEVEVDGANSDPIPHILKGIVLKVRDLRVYVDRPNFTLNPTSCEQSKAKATLFGSYLNVLDPADDVPVNLSTRYQAANCLNLGFKPKLDLQLKGGTKRGGHPGLLATYTPKKGDANVKGLVVRLPRSAFLDQAHIRTICTRVQFAAKQCPKAAQYGYIKAFTPLLDTPLEGPVWLRSSSHKLPDLVFDLHGLVDVEVATRIDSAHGGIRATVSDAPDAPLSKVILRMQGGKKGLIINSRNLCSAPSKADVQFTGHNGKQASANPVMGVDCGGGRKHKRAGR